jgi:hypothetical protein
MSDDQNLERIAIALEGIRAALEQLAEAPRQKQERELQVLRQIDPRLADAAEAVQRGESPFGPDDSPFGPDSPFSENPFGRREPRSGGGTGFGRAERPFGRDDDPPGPGGPRFR